MKQKIKTGAAGATALSQYFAVGIYGTMLWRGARAGTMAVPFFADKGKGKNKGTDTSSSNGDSAASQGGGESVKALPLLITVVSANAAMLLRCGHQNTHIKLVAVFTFPNRCYVYVCVCLSNCFVRSVLQSMCIVLGVVCFGCVGVRALVRVGGIFVLFCYSSW